MIGPENDEIDREARSAISRITHTILSFALVGGLFSLGILMTRFLWMLTSWR